MTYLVCEKCGGYYELQDGESPDDFDSCQCNGKLKVYTTLEGYYTESDPTNSYQRELFSNGKSYAEKKSSQYDLLMGISGLLALIGGFGTFISITSFSSSPPILYAILLIAGILIFRYAYREGYSWKKGIVGEEIVSEFLNELPGNYFIFNDVMLPDKMGNIDHVVIGPTGIFVIETKNFKGNYTVEGGIWQSNDNPNFKKTFSYPGKQVKSNSVALRNFLLSRKLNTNNVWINSIVAFISDSLTIKKKPKYFDILEPSELVYFITNKKKILNRELLKKIVFTVEPLAIEMSLVRQDNEWFWEERGKEDFKMEWHELHNLANESRDKAKNEYNKKQAKKIIKNIAEDLEKSSRSRSRTRWLGLFMGKRF